MNLPHLSDMYVIFFYETDMYVILVQPKTAEDSTVSAPPEFLSRSIESIKYSTVNCRIRFEHVNDSKKEQRTSTIQKNYLLPCMKRKYHA